MNKLTLSDCTILFFVYNHVETVQSSVESVVRIKAKYPGIQLFVFDDCSTDGSKEILDLFSGHYDFYCVNPRNLGFNLTFRNAILKLKTRLFFVGSHDEIYDEDIVFFTLKIFQQNDRIGFAFTDTWTINDDLPNNFKRPLYSHVYGNEFIFNKLTNNFNFSSMAKVNVLFNMEAVNTVGGVWEKDGILFDVSLFLRLCLKYNVGYIAMPLITEYPKYDNSLYPKEYSNFSYKRQLLLYRIHDDFFAVNNFSMRRLIVFGFYLNRGLIIDTLRLCIIYRNEFEDKISKFKHELFAVYFFRKLIISAVKDLKHNAQ